MTDDELLAELERWEQVHLEAMQRGEPWATQELIDKARQSREDYKRSTITAKIAAREAALAKAKMQASADRLLKAIDDHSDPNRERGN